MKGPPGLREGKYRSCPHITKDVVQWAMNCLQMSRTAVDVRFTHRCVYCGLFGALRDPIFRNHRCTLLRPIFFLRLSHAELFCSTCGEYQFCSLLDKQTGRRRAIPQDSESSTETQSLTTSDESLLPYCPAKGLVNMGATCFMNCVLQVLFHNQLVLHCRHLQNHCQVCETSRQSTFNVEDTSELCSVHSCIPCEFWALTRRIRSAEERLHALTPSHLLFAVWNSVNYMAGYAQQDAHEFLIAFLDNMDSQLGAKGRHSVDSSFLDIFSGEVESNLTCQICNDVSKKRETFVDLSLSVNANPRARDPGERITLRSVEEEPVDLLDCLREFTQSEEIHDKLFCEKCRCNQSKVKQLYVSRFPDTLILHLKRFDFARRKKITRQVLFPLKDLDLLTFMAESESTDGEEEQIFDLQGVVCHEGTLNQGHYISYVKDYSNNSWLQCNDDKVTTVTEDFIVALDAYLLFYVKRQAQTPSKRAKRE